MTPRFDPTRAIVYDLSRGQLRDEEGQLRLNVPFFLLERLCGQAGPEATRDFGQGLGGDIGRRIRDRLGAAAEQVDVSVWTEHLGGHLAVLGLGDLSLERWGRALVIRIVGAPAGASALLAAVIAGALQRGAGRNVELVAFDVEDSVALLVLSPETAGRARALREAGESLGRVVEQLHRGVA